MAQATETFAVGADQFTAVVEIDLSTVWLISGDFAGTIPSGQTGFINGDVNLTGDLIVEGLLTGIDTFTLTGNGHQILVQNGGILNLQGITKTSWVNWDDPVIGWNVGDKLAVAPTAAGVYIPPLSETTWQGSWATTVRPPNTGNVTLVDGSVARPEVANLARSVTLKNLSRVHFHDDAGVQTLKHLAVVNSGVAGVLAQYPVHFHLNGEASRGSLVEEVLVSGGKNHAFVPHGSHGITFKGCVAYATSGSAFWWDDPPPSNTADTVNDSNDVVYDHCLALWVMWSASDTTEYTGFAMTAGERDVCVDCVAVAVDGTGTGNRSGFLWGENRSRGAWDFQRNLAHNCKDSGLRTWQNTDGRHTVFDFTAYRCGRAGVDHGAYRNNYEYRGMKLTGARTLVHAKSDYDRPWSDALLFENIQSDSLFEVTAHGIADMRPSFLRDSTFPQVVYTESTHPSYWRYEDCGLIPAQFKFTGGTSGGIPVRIHPASVVEVYEAGLLVHRWNGAWT